MWLVSVFFKQYDLTGCLLLSYIGVTFVMKLVNLFFSLLFFLSTHVWADPHCTDQPKTNWISQDKMKKIIDRSGYRVEIFKVTAGNCYEIYGWNHAGDKIEVYYNPVNGKMVEMNVLS